MKKASESSRNLAVRYSLETCRTLMNSTRVCYNAYRSNLGIANRMQSRSLKVKSMTGMNRERTALRNWMGAVEVHLGLAS